MSWFSLRSQLPASTPGISLPSDAPFKPHTKPKPRNNRSSSPSNEILLHNASHAKLDYVAREEDTEKGQGLLKHYIGVYDPEKETLQLVPTRKVIVRSHLRSSETTEQNEDDALTLSQDVSSRTALGLAFGTKKSQKAIRSLTENAISSPSKGKTAAHDPLVSAVMDSMAASTADMPTRDDLQAEALSSKPIPTPNLEATTPEEVYTIDGLVGLPALRNMHVKEWMDKVNSDEEIVTRSRFVSTRVARLVKENEVKKLKALKYLLLLVSWYNSLKKTRGKLQIPKREEIETLLPGWGGETLAAVGKRFAVQHL